MEFGSICSGIEAASVAWSPLGWKAAWLAEIDKFASAVLAHHYPHAPNLGDMTTIARRVLTGEVSAPDVLCGGTPCQAFSVAGLRESLADARGNLTLKFVELADAIDHVRVRAGKPAAIVFWENVPGVLSTKDNAFGCFLAGLAGEDEPLQPPGQKWANAGAVYGPARAVAWRTMDAQYFGVAQRRRRVFVVASARNDIDPAQILFEWDGMRRDTAPSRQAGQAVASCVTAGAANGGAAHGARSGSAKDDLITPVAFGGNNQSGPIDVATARNACASASGRMDFETETFLVQPTHTLRGEGFDASEDGTGRGTPLVPVAFNWQGGGTQTTLGYDPTARVAGSLSVGQTPAIAFSSKDHGADATADLAPTLRAMGHADSHANGGGQMAVAFQSSQSGVRTGDTHATLDANNGPRRHNGALIGMQVRRLTPVECERLQGFPDGYTRLPNWSGWRALDEGEDPDQLRAEGLQVKQSKKTGKWRVNDPDGPRYKALGNSWAVPNAAWIGRRIAAAVQRAS